MLNAEAILAGCPPSLPRYTSYPTAPHFSAPAAEPLSGRLMSEAANCSGLSIYIHIPFCDRLCWFCGCNTKQTLKYGPVKTYVGYLERELDLVRTHFDQRVPMRHLHLGGGSPSMLKAEDFVRLREALERVAIIGADAEVSVEIDPSDNNPELLEGLHKLGTTRCSIGVQDFDPQVQAAINRIQTEEETRRTIADLRDLGVGSINIDVLYGLPHQTLERLHATIDKVIALQPDRIALFGYAHVPWMKKHQTLIEQAALPGSLERFEQAAASAGQLTRAGYARIGLDHFARPDDDLAKAAHEGRLHRNFQGYTTDESSVLLGLGASAISRCSAGLLQSEVATAQYQQRLLEGHLPHAKGIAFTRDDVIRGWIIEQLMCDLRIAREQLHRLFPAEAESYWQLACSLPARLADGLCLISGDVFIIPEEARNFVRLVAAQFDAYLGHSAARYSKAI